MPADFASTNEQKVSGIVLTPLSAGGKPAKMDGAMTWETVVDGGADIVVNMPDGLNVTLVSGDDPGISQFLVKGDADLGAGVVEISDLVTYTVNGALAANIGFGTGTVEPK